MEQWLISHWHYLSGSLSALLALLSAWRFGPRFKGWCIGRIAVEKDLLYCRRENAILESYIEKVERRLANAGLTGSDDGSA